MHLGLEAFAYLQRRLNSTYLTLVGDGPMERRWRNQADRLGLSGYINWIPWVNQKDLSKLYAQHHALLFPSLRDSGGMVVLEGMSNGLPVVCLDLGGPGIMVNPTCGYAVDLRKRNRKQVVDAMGETLVELATDTAQWERLRAGAVKRAGEFSWARTVANIYNPDNG